MTFSVEPNRFQPKAAILLAGMCYQTYPLFFDGALILPIGFKLRFKLRYTIRAFADVENPTEHVFGFLAESKDTIVVALRGTRTFNDNEFLQRQGFLEHGVDNK